tara:strand:- start:4808 stop:4990 length:183 start_codon:yes stop_codon:yes gene_type:complete
VATSESNAELLNLLLAELDEMKDETIKENVLMQSLTRAVSMKDLRLLASASMPLASSEKR